MTREAPAKLGVAEQAGERRRERGDVARRHQQPGALVEHNLVVAGDPRRRSRRIADAMASSRETPAVSGPKDGAQKTSPSRSSCATPARGRRPRKRTRPSQAGGTRRA